MEERPKKNLVIKNMGSPQFKNLTYLNLNLNLI